MDFAELYKDDLSERLWLEIKSLSRKCHPILNRNDLTEEEKRMILQVAYEMHPYPEIRFSQEEIAFICQCNPKTLRSKWAERNRQVRKTT